MSLNLFEAPCGQVVRQNLPDERIDNSIDASQVFGVRIGFGTGSMETNF